MISSYIFSLMMFFSVNTSSSDSDIFTKPGGKDWEPTKTIIIDDIIGG